MALPMRVLWGSIFVLFLIVMGISVIHVDADVVNPSWKHAPHNVMREGIEQVKPKQHRPKFQPGPWKQAHATFYEGSPQSYGGACGYEDVEKEGYGKQTAAVSQVVFKEGQACGACFEIQCMNSAWCKHVPTSLLVTATDYCPPNFNQATDNGGWCNPPREHFDLAIPAYLSIAQYKGGIVPVKYRRVPCRRQGGIRFTISGNPYFNLVSVWNVGGAGDVISLQVKGNKKLKWTALRRNWGQKWETNAMLVGESLTFRVRTSDGRYSTSWHVAPPTWQFGITYEGKNFT